MTARLVVVGDALLDRDISGRAGRLCPDAPVPVIEQPATVSRPGGAGLAAALAAADGLAVSLVTPLAGDDAGAELAGLLEAAGVHVVPLPVQGTTAQKVRVRAGDHAVARLDYGRSGAVGPLTDEAADVLRSADGILVSDYGRGATAEPTVRGAVESRSARVPVVWDPHPRGAEPVAGATLVSPNVDEAGRAAGQALRTLADVTAAGVGLLRRWGVTGVAVTRGPDGALLVAADGTPLAVPAPSVTAGDPCGAGDRFASRAAHTLVQGRLLSEAVVDAVQAASAFVAAGGAGGALPGSEEARHPAAADAAALAARVRAEGGTVVATGGCFDLLHAGHVRMLQAARSLGDALIVCLNSDASVRRLKGPDRPLVPQSDRAAVLAGLGCVDAVAVFEEDTPEAVLARLRPHVWAKGADYAVADLPEAGIVAGWGGQAVVLPYLDGRSTTTLIQEVTRRGGA